MEFGPILRTMRHNKMGVGLLVVEIAITMAIVLNAFTLVRDNIARLSIESGLDVDNMIDVSVSAYGASFRDDAYFHQVFDRDLQALRAMDGVVSAGHVAPTPLQGGGSSMQLKPRGADDGHLVRCPRYNVDPSVLDTLGVELLEGRGFTHADVPDPVNPPDDPPPLNVLVTKGLADALFPDGDGLGRQASTSDGEAIYQIVGIIKYMWTPYDNGSSGMESRIVFFPFRRASPGSLGYMVRCEPGMRDRILPEIEQALLAVQPERVVTATPLTEIRSQGMAFNSLIVRSLGTIMALLVFVTGLGIYGLTSFAVAGRTRQIGTRRALGATRRDIVRYFLVEISLTCAMGMTLGGMLAFLLNRAIVIQADGSPLSLGLVLLSAAILWLIGLASALQPAIKAASVPPVVATQAG